MADERGSARNLLSVTALIWLGMLIGVSFLATPVKFLAPSLSLPVALDVGRQTFAVFSVVEVAAFFLLLAAAWIAGRRLVYLAVLIGCLVAIQFFWLLPALDARVELILRGETPIASSLHTFYIACEAAKLVLLAVIALQCFVSTDVPARE